MKISELIEKAQEIMDDNGDLDVEIYDTELGMNNDIQAISTFRFNPVEYNEAEIVMEILT